MPKASSNANVLQLGQMTDRPWLHHRPETARQFHPGRSAVPAARIEASKLGSQWPYTRDNAEAVERVRRCHDRDHQTSGPRFVIFAAQPSTLHVGTQALTASTVAVPIKNQPCYSEYDW
jgi:hypothetical protein